MSVSKSRLQLMLLVIAFLSVALAWSNVIAEKGNIHTIQIPLKLIKKSEKKSQGWKIIQFENKQPNKVISNKKGLHINVKSSANLLAYCFNEPVDINSVLLQGSFTGLPKIQENKQQGDKTADDFAIRFGLVFSGTKKPSPIDKLFASELVKRLCELVPSSQGIDRVLFLNLANDPPPKWRERIHPIGKGLIHEKVCCIADKPGDFMLRAEFLKPSAILALCIICDGDDTNSKFEINIKNIQLNPKSKKACTETKL